jgi:1,4-dihydroxy-2-naphthoate octaprenyltransferase
MDPLQPASTIQSAPQRSTFLTVLCILTFLGSGYSLVTNISNYLNANVSSSFVQQTLDETQSKIDKDLDGDEKANDITNKMMSDASKLASPENLKKSALFSILANVLTLGGALLMFMLRKPGFWLYVAGTLVSIIAPLVIYGTSNIVGLGMTVLISFFGILFVVLYALNLKQLR